MPFWLSVNVRFQLHRIFRRTLFAVGAALLLGSCNGSGTQTATTMVSGVHHLGPKFTIYQFYLAGASAGSNVGWSGGGDYTCCVIIPRQWRPGTFVDVRWEVHDWRNEKAEEVERGENRSLVPSRYHARVQIERYDVPGSVYVHFFKGGKVRLVSSMVAVNSKDHPVKWGEYDEDPLATQGKPVDALFSEAELAAMRERKEDLRRKHGDWR